MIISCNEGSDLEDFRHLISNATIRLNADADSRSEYYLTRNGQRLEDDIEEMLKISAENTEFEGTIKKVSGQKFPDIVAKNYFGIEVKSSKDKNWTTLGGSINESTRIKGIERIFLMFGKLSAPVEFRCRPYEDCLSDIVVTHFPRYKIDMNLGIGETIFDRMETTYDSLRTMDDPVHKIITHYKGELKDGEGLWWTEGPRSVNLSYAPMKIRLWRTLSAEEKKEQRIIYIALFPGILSNSSTKYDRLSVWLASQCGIISTSMRDIFTAGGQVDIRTKTRTFERLPRVFEHIYSNKKDIASYIYSVSEDLLCETWDREKIEDDRIAQWVSIASELCYLGNHDVRQVLNAFFDIGEYSFQSNSE